MPILFFKKVTKMCIVYSKYKGVYFIFCCQSATINTSIKYSLYLCETLIENYKSYNSLDAFNCIMQYHMFIKNNMPMTTIKCKLFNFTYGLNKFLFYYYYSPSGPCNYYDICNSRFKIL